MLNWLIKYFLENKLVTLIFMVILITWGVITAPFNWDISFLPRDPVPVDAIPDIGENQQIISTEWMGRSPQDIEDQITYPLMTSLLGLPSVKSIRSTSMFGLSTINIIFSEDAEYYWSRSRVLEKLNSLSPTLLPQGVAPTLGPDATGLGQVFWYTLEGRDEKGNPAGGWDPQELRSIQDYYVRYGLTATEGVSEVASIGGFVKEYQVDLNPIAMKAHKIGIMEVMEALRKSNQDIGANTVELNLVEYYVRGLGYIKTLQDIENAVVAVSNNVPIRIKDIAKVNEGPAPRGHTGFLDKGGVEAVGGVVIARYGDNPLRVIEGVKKKITEITPGLPSKILDDGRLSKVTLIPFYDRSTLIFETLGTLYEAISLQILITIIVIIVMVFHLRASILISALLPIAVLFCFIFMKYFKVDANIVALSGIAIAIGTMVDLGIILSENILRHMEESSQDKPLLKLIFDATTEVSSAILTAVSTTIISFFPVFTLQAAEGKLFGPLAYTKTFALIAALIITLFIMPMLAHLLFSLKVGRIWKGLQFFSNILLALTGLGILYFLPLLGFTLLMLGTNGILYQYAIVGKISNQRVTSFLSENNKSISIWIICTSIIWLLSSKWLPVRGNDGLIINFIFTSIIILSTLGIVKVFIEYYPKLLLWCLDNKKTFLKTPLVIIFIAFNIWMGFDTVFGIIPRFTKTIGWDIRTSYGWKLINGVFPGMEKEFMPSLNEGSFLLMPTSMPHSGVEANLKFLKQIDIHVEQIPEVESVVGKAGRVMSAIDSAPVSMFENIIQYKSEFKTDENGYPIRFQTDSEGKFTKDENGNFIRSSTGRFYRQWREHIQSSDDIWKEIIKATKDIPGITSAPKLQPIETRLVMLQTGMRAPMGLKVFGPNLKVIEEFSLELEKILKEVPSVQSNAVFADRSLGKPYLEIKLNRIAMSRHGMNVMDVQSYLEVAIGGMPLTTTVEGRERYNIRARYAREWRDNPDAMKRIFIPTPMGSQIPLSEIADIVYRPGPMMIRGENTFLLGYVLLDKKEGFSEGFVVDEASNYINNKIETGELIVPPGASFQFSGNYENQSRAEKRLMIVVPIVLILIFLILYFQFRSITTSLMIFSAIILAFSGGFILLWLYGQDWFLNFSLFGTNMRDLFLLKKYNLSVAVWVGFIALFGIATDDGVVIATYLQQSFRKNKPETVEDVRNSVLEAGKKRLRPCLMTTTTTLLALLPVLTSTGRGADIMIPMAIPAFGGMTFALITLFLIPVLYSAKEEFMIRRRQM